MAIILEKGQSILIDKQPSINRIDITFGWKSGKDVDFFAFLLGSNGIITNDADFVFYNSETRERPLIKEVFKNKRQWRATTRPMSADGSVLGPSEDNRLKINEDQNDFDFENMIINLNKVGPGITEIALCFAKYRGDIEDIHSSRICDPFISITNLNTHQEICRYDLNEIINSSMAVWAGSFIKDENGNWSFKAIGQTYPNGIQALINLFA